MGNKCATAEKTGHNKQSFAAEDGITRGHAEAKVIHATVVVPRSYVGNDTDGITARILAGAGIERIVPSLDKVGPSSSSSVRTSTAEMPSAGKSPPLSVSYSWADRRTARREQRRRRKGTPKRKKGKEKLRKGKRGRKLPWKRRRRRQRHGGENPSPPFPICGGGSDRRPGGQALCAIPPIQIQFVAEYPTSVDLCVVFNPNTATHKFAGSLYDEAAKIPCRAGGGQRVIFRAAGRPCFSFSDEISTRKKHYSHCFSVEFQIENVRHVTHFRELDRIVLLWALKIGGGGGAEDLTNVPVLLSLPRRRGSHANGERGETMDMIVCDAHSTAWMRRRRVQLFPVHQIKAADIQAFMATVTEEEEEEGEQSSCSEAASQPRRRRRRWSRRKIEESRRKTPSEAAVVPERGYPAGLDLAGLRRITKATHPQVSGLSSTENSPRCRRSSSSTPPSPPSLVDDGSRWFSEDYSSSSAHGGDDWSPSGEDEGAAPYIQLPEDSAGRLISDSMGSGGSPRSSSASVSARRHRKKQQQQKKTNNNKESDASTEKRARSLSTPVGRKTSDVMSTAELKTKVTELTKKRDLLILKGLTDRVKEEIEQTEDPAKVSPRRPSPHLRPDLMKGIEDKMKKKDSDTLVREIPDRPHLDLSEISRPRGREDPACLSSPRQDRSLSPRTLSPRRRRILAEAERRKQQQQHDDDDESSSGDGSTTTTTTTSGATAEETEEEEKEEQRRIAEEKRQQRRRLVALLDRQEADKLKKSPRERLKKTLRRTLSFSNDGRKRSSSLPPLPHVGGKKKKKKQKKRKTTPRE